MNVVSQPVGLLRLPLWSNSIFQSAPRAVSILKRSPFLLKAKPLATSGWEPNVLAALRDVGVTVIVPSGNARLSRPTPPTPLTSRLTSFAIGWMRKTSSQLTAGVELQFAPGPVIFQTLPRPVVPSLAQRFPFVSKASPLAPGVPVANGTVTIGGLTVFGVKL